MTTASTTRPPFRADQVGSLLRPEALKEARVKFLGEQSSDSNLGPHDNADLRAVEDQCVREVVAMQEKVGLKAVTDGEFRRRSWWLDLITGWEGFGADRTGTMEFSWRNAKGERMPFSRLWVNGKIGWRPSATARGFEYLKANTRAVPKVTLPAPMVVHMYAGGDKAIGEGHYKDMNAFWDDVVAAYRQEVQALIAAGARYIQFDDTCFAFLCDAAHRTTVQNWGRDPNQLIEEYADKMNQIVAGAPADVTFTLHQCRGNREGNWAAEGGYDPVADVMFNRMNVHGFFLEYDSARTGSFAPLKLLPKGKTVVLGLVSSKTNVLEKADDLRRRIDEAAQYAPLDQLALSPQCGFASSIKGNPLSHADQEAKLRLIVEVADAVWQGK
ncbi:MAG: 5-methyltetrahydropteroyltriglutamate--homocysteine S-methyltransferase [Betaproteobacteria bacterium]|nr:5-methyltetrahydropteroyltriglutamate--homocysteine S-methyltransferase [Betaproteobacteria bacterium]